MEEAKLSAETALENCSELARREVLLILFIFYSLVISRFIQSLSHLQQWRTVSVASHVANFSSSLLVKEFWRSVTVWQRYDK